MNNIIRKVSILESVGYDIVATIAEFLKWIIHFGSQCRPTTQPQRGCRPSGRPQAACLPGQLAAAKL